MTRIVDYVRRLRSTARHLGVPFDIRDKYDLFNWVGNRPSQEHWVVLKEFKKGFVWGNIEWVRFNDPEHPVAHPFKTSQGIVNVYTLGKILRRRPDTIYAYIRKHGDPDQYIEEILATHRAGAKQRSKWIAGAVIGKARVVETSVTTGKGRNRTVILECVRCLSRKKMSRTHALLLTSTDTVCGCRFLPAAERRVRNYTKLSSVPRSTLLRRFGINGSQFTLAIRETKDIKRGLVKCIVDKKLKELREAYLDNQTNS